MDGKLLLLNKPLNWTSFDLVRKVRTALKYHIGIKKIKVGHAGTLDPLASGLMIICTGRATKKLVGFQDLDKEYVAGIRFGATTPSYDLETEIDQEFATDQITEEALIQKLDSFLGPQMQLPPIFSAKKISGKRAYNYAREGLNAEIPKQAIVINEIELQEFSLPEALIRVSCSKGTYIRSLAHDLGKSMNSGAHLCSLVRTKIGPFLLDEAESISEFEEKLRQT